jgi:hypothetical protein
MLQLIAYVIALVLLLLAAFGVGYRRVHFGWLGLALWLFAAVLLHT